MFALTNTHRFLLYNNSCDMRKGFYGLSGLVRNELQGDPLNGDVYIFMNKSRTTMKLLVFEGDGFLLYHKRLEAGRFQRPSHSAGGTCKLSYQQLQLILQGIDLRHIKQRKRFSFTKAG